MRAIGAVAVVLWLLMSGCATTGVSQSPGRPTVYEDPGSPGRVQGVGIESQDIQSMADRMVRDMLANQYLAGRSTSPRVIIDAEYFRNESSQPINKNLITDKLRVDLNRAANGRMVFVGRNYANMVQEERELKREGVVTGGTGGTSPAPAGADYRLGGRIASLDQADVRTGLVASYHQITFEMVDLETSVIVWSNQYEFRKSSFDDVLYR